MHLERDLSPAFDEREPAWGDEDAAPRAESLWLARARASAARVEPHDEVSIAPAPVLADAVPVAAVTEPSSREDLAWFAPEPEAPAQDDPHDLVHDENRAATQGPSDGDTSWFVGPELPPGTIEALAPTPAAAAQPTEFPPAWFPAPEPAGEAAPEAESPEALERAAALSAALARFEAGQPLPGVEPAPAPEAVSLEPAREVHAWFPSSQAFLDTLSAEAAAVGEEPPRDEAPAVFLEVHDAPAAVEQAQVADAQATEPPAVTEAVFAADEQVTVEADYDVLPAVARWRAAQEASLEAWVAAATRTIEGWPRTAAVDVRTAEPPFEAARPIDTEPVDTATVVDAAPADDDPLPVAAVEPFAAEPDAVAAADVEPAVEAPAADEALPSDSPVTPPPVPVVAAAPVAARPRPRRLRRVAALAAACVAGVAVVGTMLVPKLSLPRQGAMVTPVPAVVAAPAPAPARVAPVAAPRAVVVPAVTSSTPRWHETREWTGGRKKSVAFELAAEQPVRTWMRHVTPVLVVRCLNGTLDAFVVTQSASAIEAGRTDHTVRLAFDDGTEAEERWVDSAEHDGLFAPDGRAVLARAARSGRLRFTFTPHNAPAAETSFSLAGIESLQAPLTKYCK